MKIENPQINKQKKIKIKNKINSSRYLIKIYI
jgi:hypothetical protein